MSELTNSERVAYAMVDEALQTYPLATPPDTLLPAVMSHIRRLDSSPHFRLDWLDYVLSLFAAGMAGIVMMVWPLVYRQSFGNHLTEIFNGLQPLDLIYLWLTIPGGLLILTGIALFVALITLAWTHFSLSS
jgi:hypothetical protein